MKFRNEVIFADLVIGLRVVYSTEVNCQLIAGYPAKIIAGYPAKSESGATLVDTQVTVK